MKTVYDYVHNESELSLNDDGTIEIELSDCAYMGARHQMEKEDVLKLFEAMKQLFSCTSESAGSPIALDELRNDLIHQLGIPDELDWDYFVEAALRARDAANLEDRNMTENLPDERTEKQEG